MKNKILVSLVSLSLLAVSVFLIYGCGTNPTSGGGGTTAHGTYSYFGTQSGGDAWKWIIGAGTFIGTNETIGFTVSGTWETLPSGFYKATVMDSSGSGAPTPGSQAYFLEVWDTALIVKPTSEEGGSEEDKVIVCGSLSTIPPSPGLYTWITMPRSDWTADDEVYGTALISGESPNITIEVTSYTTADAMTPWSPTTESGFSFSGGILSRAGGDTKVSIATSGLFVGDQGSGEGGFIGSGKPTSDLRSAAASHQYRGVLFKYHPGVNSSGETEPIGAEPNGTNKLFGFSFSNVDDGTRYTGGGVTVEMTSFDPAKGIVSGTITETSGSNSMKMLINQINGKFVIFGLQADDDGLPNNFIVVQID